jgi:hypothetical protein
MSVIIYYELSPLTSSTKSVPVRAAFRKSEFHCSIDASRKRRVFPERKRDSFTSSRESLVMDMVHNFSTLKRVEKERELLPLPVRKVYFSNPKRSSGNVIR